MNPFIEEVIKEQERTKRLLKERLLGASPNTPEFRRISRERLELLRDVIDAVLESDE
ncbi:MAG: hypothetical protein IRZ19_13395 [Pyrinomonas methylaliphatogenes]|nr:hypothetical protein [Pyrinomonas methylaliphatogenes]